MSEVKIDMEFARRDDCLDRMVPSDLRMLIAERDAALAELAALKGGREAVAEIGDVISRKQKLFSIDILRADMLHHGTKLYTAPPAQASAWVQTSALYEAVKYLDDNPLNAIAAGSMLHRAMRHAIAAPTPGASDGKGGES